MKKLITVCTFSILLNGCSSFNIYDSNKKKLGIPFYIKTAVVKQNSVYTRSWIETTIRFHKIQDKNKIENSEKTATFFISQDTYNQTELLKSFSQSNTLRGGVFNTALTNFQKQLEKSCKTDNKVNCIITQQTLTKELSIATQTPKSLLQTLESNSSAYETMVDYGKLYYFNATIPPFGTTTATAKLSPDGTLSEASSTVDASKLADLIPLKELLVDKWGLDKKSDVSGLTNKPQKDYSLTISINVNGYKYTLTKYHPYNSGLNLAPLLFSSKEISVSKVGYGGSQKKEGGSSEKNKNSILIEGAIILPKK